MAAIIERPSPLTGVAHSGIALGAAAFMFFRQVLDASQQDPGKISQNAEKLLRFSGSGLLVIGLLAAVIGIGIWRTTTFVVADDEFRVDRKLLWSSSSRVEYTKVQSIEISQPFFARLLGLAKIHIDVGGSGGVDLAFLSVKRAESLREHLIARTKLVSPSTDDASTASDLETASAPEPVSAETVLVTVRPTTLALGNLVSTQLFPMLLIAAFTVLLGLLDRSITIIALTVMILSWAYRQFAGNWNFTITARGEALRLSHGLFSTHTQSVIPSRVQGVAIEQDILQQCTGLYRVRITVLGRDMITNDGEVSSNVLLPYGTWPDVVRILSVLWPDIDLYSFVKNGQPKRARWLTPLSFANQWWAVSDTAAAAQHGFIQRIITIVPHRRMQSLGLSQGPLQRKLRLASLSVHTTDGPAKLELFHLEEHQARELFEQQLERGRLARRQAD